MLKRFLKDNRGQSFTETGIFFLLVYIYIASAMIFFGFFQLTRQRMNMSNFYMGYTHGFSHSYGSSSLVKQRTKEMLEKGAPVIAKDKTPWINDIDPSVSGRSGQINSQIKTEIKFNSAVLERLYGQLLVYRSYRFSATGPKKP
ncbi:MAG: hypothetical protein JW827_02845 [Spirochaetes bacterium]|nr:hypothetical protein [Spirochaetota bacterium]